MKMEVGVLKMKVGVVSLTVLIHQVVLVQDHHHQPLPHQEQDQEQVQPLLLSLLLLLLHQEQDQEHQQLQRLPERVDHRIVQKYMDNVVVIKTILDQNVVAVDNVLNTMITTHNVYHKLIQNKYL